MKELRGSRTYDNLLMAFAGETQARTKYSIFASKAKEEGYHQIGRIFDIELADDVAAKQILAKKVAVLRR